MVSITNDTHILAIRIPERQSQGATILDLRTEQGRADANLTQDQDLKWATTTHDSLIYSTVPLSAYLAVGPAPAHSPSPLFHVSRDIWAPPDDGDKTSGPQKGYDPSSGREFRTLSSESLDHISLTGIQRVSAPVMPRSKTKVVQNSQNQASGSGCRARWRHSTPSQTPFTHEVPSWPRLFMATGVH